MDKKKVLLVEDEQNIVLVIKKLLETEGFNVLVVHDGISAVETAFNEKPDLILLDLLLPKMNGYLVCETLKENSETEKIPIIIISAKAEEKNVKKAKKLGATDYLVKPLETKKLIQIIKKHLNQQV